MKDSTPTKVRVQEKIARMLGLLRNKDKEYPIGTIAKMVEEDLAEEEKVEIRRLQQMEVTL